MGLPRTKKLVSMVDHRQSCAICREPAGAWFSRVYLCVKHLTGASDARDAVPLPTPPATSPGDARVLELRRAQDIAVSEWVEARIQERGAA